ncbi:MAG: GNAT family N-acetyltransferase [Anaerolineales bacterium]|nr:GNAT family N-acetyltransferase [Anaerolineales bacterium]
MNTNEILALYDEQERKNSIHPSFQRETSWGVVRHVNLDPSRRSFIVYSELTEANANQVIAEQRNWYKNEVNGAGLEWKIYDHDVPPDLKERLSAQGFEAEEVEALLVLDLEQCPPVYLQPVTVDVRRITDPEQLGDVPMIQEAAWGSEFGWLEKTLQDNLTKQPDFWSIYIAYVDDAPACAAWISFPPDSQFAGLWGGATVPAYRKMGVYTAVVATRVQEAIQRGYRFLTVDASDMSRPILEKRGFQLLTYTTPFVWKPET